MAARRTKTDAPAHETFLVRNQSQRRGPILAVAVHSTESQDIPDSTDDLKSPSAAGSTTPPRRPATSASTGKATRSSGFTPR
jgi:hypothetical protein